MKMTSPNPDAKGAMATIYSPPPAATPAPYGYERFPLSDDAGYGSRLERRGGGAGRWRRHCHWLPPWRWHSSFNMYAFFLLGVASAVGHHVFYNSLSGRVAENQLRMQRYGTLLAFVSKASLSSAVVMAFRQRVWATVRARLLTVAALDSMFAANEDLTALLNWEFVSCAKTAAALALFSWLAPLMVILTANTLLVEMQTVSYDTTCPGVRTLNFSLERTSDWRHPVEIEGLWEVPVSLWNTTKPDAQPENTTGWFDYYTGPSPSWEQTAVVGGFLGEPVGRKNASAEICGTGWNCSFAVQFVAPGYRCTEVASGVGSVPRNLTQQSGEAVPPFGTDVLIPRGRHTYYAHASGGEYSMEQLKDVGVGGIPKKKPYPRHLGALRTEPVVWVGFAVVADPARPRPDSAADPDWDSAFVPKIFACEHRETAYDVRFTYVDGTQDTKVLRRTHLGPIINTTFVPGVMAEDGTQDNTTATPEANYVYPTDVGRYRLTAAYHSLGLLLREFVNGTVTVEQSLSNPIANTKAIQTKLLNPRSNYFPYPDLMDLVSELYEDLILSMFSNPQFVEVVWATSPHQQTGEVGEVAATAAQSQADEDGEVVDDSAAAIAASRVYYPCTRSRVTNLYTYDARILWAVYGVAVALSLLGVGAGMWALRENGGVTRNTRFSSIVAATRGPALEKVDWAGPGLDLGDVPSDVKKLRLGYGRIDGAEVGTADGGGGGGGGGGVGDGGDGGGARITRPGTWTTISGGAKCGFGLEGDVSRIC